jgi:DME family drug/metabolite transporter
VNLLASRALPYAVVALAACTWGTWAMVLRSVEARWAMPSAVEATVTMAVITLVSALAMVRDRTHRPASWKARAWVVCSGFADALNVLLFFAAYRHAIAVSVLTHYLMPVFVAAAAPFVLGEKMTARSALAIALSLSGLGVMVGPSITAASGHIVLVSALLGAGSAVFYATNVIANKFVAGSFSTNETLFWHGLVATPFLAAFVPPGAWATLDPRGVLVFGALAVFPGALAGMAFLWGLRRIPAAHASTLALLEPLVATLLGTIFLGEHAGFSVMIGGPLILMGAVLVLAQPAAPNEPASGGRSTW